MFHTKPILQYVTDLYRGELATDNEEASHLMDNLDWKGAVADIQGAAKFLIDKGCSKVWHLHTCLHIIFVCDRRLWTIYLVNKIVNIT